MSTLDALVVAADDPKIVAAVERFGGRAVLTRSDHQSGTERVAEAADHPEYSSFDPIVNIQGDEPFLPPAAVEAAVEGVRSGWDIGTAAVEMDDAEEWRDPAVVKVVRDDRGGALYFSRAPIPYGAAERDAIAFAGARRLRHLGLYAFSRPALRAATALPAHPLEESEGLEQLRWLAGGLRIAVAIVEGGGPGVDTESDLIKAETLLKKGEFR